MSKNDKTHNIYNVCSNNPVNIKKIINKFKKNNNFKLMYVKRHVADVLHTHGSNLKILKKTKYRKLTKSDIGIKNSFDWYNKLKIYNI